MFAGSKPAYRTKVGNLIGEGTVCKTVVGAFDSHSDLQFKLCPYGGTEDTLGLEPSALIGMGVQIPLRVP